MTLNSRFDELLRAFGTNPKMLRQFIDLNLDPSSKYHHQVIDFTIAVDAVLDGQDILVDWARGHIHMRKREQDPYFEAEARKLGERQAEFVRALRQLLEAFLEANHGNA